MLIRVAARWKLMVPAVLVGLAATIFCYAWIQHQGGDVSRLVVAGDLFVDPAKHPDCLTVHRDSGGYDGQFYYRLAIDPFSTAPHLAGVRFDYPVYRSQRILYPAVAHIVALGDTCRVLWALVIVNIGALMLLAWASARLIVHTGAPPIAGIAAALWPGFLFSLARDLTEPLAAALLVLGVLAVTQRKLAWAALWLSCAALTRETTLLFPIALVGYGLARSVRARRLDVLLAVGATPLLVYFSWKRWLFWWWDLPANWGVSQISGVPLAAWATLLRDSSVAGSHLGRAHVIELLVWLLFAALVLIGLRSSRTHGLVKIATVVYFVFVTSLSRDIWIEDWAFLRATTEFGVLGAIVLATASPLLRRAGFALLTIGAATLACEMLLFR